MTTATIDTEDQLREAQWALMDRLYGDNAQDKAAANVAYDANVERARALGLLDTAHCNSVDPDKFNLYSDCFKSENGFRPRFHVTRADVETFLARANSQG